MRHSIRLRIGLPFVLLICALIIGLGLYFSNYLNQTYLSVLESELLSQARLASSFLAAELDSGAEPARIDKQAHQLSQQTGKRITIIAQDGVVIGESQYDRATMENHLSRPEIIRARFSGQGTEIRYSDTLGVAMMYAAVAVRNDREETIGYVRVAMPLQDIQNRLDRLQRILLGVMLAAAVLASALAWWIASRTTRPLRQLSQAAEQVAQGHMESHLLPASNDEIGQLTRQFNEMTVQLGAHLQALETERSRMAAILDATTDGVLMIDRDGGVQLMNKSAETIFEIQHAEVAGRSLIEVLRHHQILELWESCRRSGEMQTTIIEIPARRLYLQCIATPLGRSLPGNTLLLFQNLTHLRRLETVRQDFVSNISHELRTPLASLKALTETLQEGALDDPPAARRFLDRMVTEVDALSQMVEELFELTRIESGRAPLKVTPVSPCRLISQAVDRLNVQAERAGLTIDIDCPDDLAAVLADARRLEHVIVNLLHNAIKFTPAGGRIQLSAEGAGEFIKFCVQDTGIGIPVDNLARIFERFYKTDRARTSGGAGLGLAIARHLVEAHGGRIWAESAEGKGSAFYFTIPITS